MLEATETASPARRRVIGFLLEELNSVNAKERAVTITLPVAKRMVASRLGTTGETLSRVFRDLNRRG